MMENPVGKGKMPRYVASDLGLHNLTLTLLQEWVNSLTTEK